MLFEGQTRAMHGSWADDFVEYVSLLLPVQGGLKWPLWLQRVMNH